MKKFMLACLLLGSMGLCGCESWSTDPNVVNRWVGQPGEVYTCPRAGYVVRQNMVYVKEDIYRAMLLDKPSMNHESFVDY